MWLTKRKSLAEAYYSMFTAKGETWTSRRGVPHFRNSSREFRSNCDRVVSNGRFLPVCDNGDPDLVINILFSRKSLGVSLSLAVYDATSRGSHRRWRRVAETNIFQRERENRRGMEITFRESFLAEGKRRESFLNHPFPVRSRRSGAFRRDRS